MTRKLVVFVPAIKDGVESWRGLRDRLATEPEYDGAVFVDVPHGARWYKPLRMTTLASRLADRIDAEWTKHEAEVDEIVLVGHSFGALALRQTYLAGLAAGTAERPGWAGRVTRIVLFAGMNRGIQVKRSGDGDRSLGKYWMFRPIAWVMRTLPLTRAWLVNDLLHGSVFMTTMRIDWIRALDSIVKPPEIFQLRGDADDLVLVQDSHDIGWSAHGAEITVPSADHSTVIRIDDAEWGEIRYGKIRRAFLERAADVDEPGQRAARPTAGTVVFLLHGIRADNEGWVEETKALILARSADAGAQELADVDVVDASYGYFSARKFAFPNSRRRFLGWLQDAYAERLAANPGATFHFIGHSNGTYLLGHSLRTISSMTFANVVLVATVLPTRFPWSSIFARGQVKKLQIHRANRDIPVGILCRILAAFRMPDVGTAGVDGFYGFSSPDKDDVHYYEGGHSSALASENLPHMVDFIQTGVAEPRPMARAGRLFKTLSRAAALIAFAVLALLVYLAVTMAIGGPFPWFVDALVILGPLAFVYVVLDLV